MNRVKFSHPMMLSSQRYIRAHMEYVRADPSWDPVEALYRRLMADGEVWKGNCKDYALNACFLLFYDYLDALPQADKQVVGAALRIGFFDTAPNEGPDLDHVATLAWDGHAWRLVADTMNRWDDLPRVQDLAYPIRKFIDLTDLRHQWDWKE